MIIFWTAKSWFFWTAKADFFELQKADFFVMARNAYIDASKVKLTHTYVTFLETNNSFFISDLIAKTLTHVEIKLGK